MNLTYVKQNNVPEDYDLDHIPDGYIAQSINENGVIHLIKEAS
tara:strand:+ start:156 stop:284 length:129 start_codon:yes stop_codon:yes gene_type:complete